MTPSTTVDPPRPERPLDRRDPDTRRTAGAIWGGAALLTGFMVVATVPGLSESPGLWMAVAVCGAVFLASRQSGVARRARRLAHARRWATRHDGQVDAGAVIVPLDGAGDDDAPDADRHHDLLTRLHDQAARGLAVRGGALHIALDHLPVARRPLCEALDARLAACRPLAGFSDPQAAWSAALALRERTSAPRFADAIGALAACAPGSALLDRVYRQILRDAPRPFAAQAAITLADGPQLRRFVDAPDGLDEAELLYALHAAWEADPDPAHAEAWSRHARPEVRRAACALDDDPLSLPTLRRLLDDEVAEVAIAAGWALIRRAEPDEALPAARRVATLYANAPVGGPVEWHGAAAAVEAVELLGERGDPNDAALLARIDKRGTISGATRGAIAALRARHPDVVGGALALVDEHDAAGGVSLAEGPPAGELSPTRQ